MNIAVVGVGYWGLNLVRNFDQLGVLRCICDSNPDRVNSLAKQSTQLQLEPDYETILADPEIEGVVIATPAETHYGLVKRALHVGKDVFVEKPMTLHCEETEELTLLADRLGRVLMVGHLLEYHPAITT